MNKHILIIVTTLMMTFNADAIVELRAGYGVNTPADNSVTSTASLSTMSGFNLDGIVELPMVPFGFGLRYESMGMDVETASANYASDMERISLLVNYRIIDMFLYFGVIGTIGFSNEVTINNIPTVQVPTGTDLTYDADLTYSVGVEGGVTFGLLMIGGELGYNIAKYENTSNDPSEVDFDGVYAKILVGVSL